MRIAIGLITVIALALVGLYGNGVLGAIGGLLGAFRQNTPRNANRERYFRPAGSRSGRRMFHHVEIVGEPAGSATLGQTGPVSAGDTAN